MIKPEEAQWRRGMADILDELNKLFDADEIGAVHISVVRRDGDVRTLQAFDNGFRILLIAAAAIGQREALEAATIKPDPTNFVVSGPKTSGGR